MGVVRQVPVEDPRERPRWSGDLWYRSKEREGWGRVSREWLRCPPFRTVRLQWTFPWLIP